MKNNLKRYLVFAWTGAAFLFLLGGNSSVAAAKDFSETGTAQSKQNDADASLMEAFRQVRSAEGDTENQSSDAARFTQQSKLTAADGMSNDNLGNSVAIAGNTAVIAAAKAKIGANTTQGAVYVFVRNSANVWTFQQKLTASDGAAGDQFGVSVAIADIPAPAETMILIGAFGNDANGHPNQGAVYVFERVAGATTWASNQKLTAMDGVANDTFGFSVAMTGNFAIIGANNADTPGRNDVGAAYIFARSLTAWSQEAKLTTPGGGGNADHFGTSVSISGSLAAIGSNITGSQLGYAYVFERIPNTSVWESQFGVQSAGKFGASVAISDGTLLVGAPEAAFGANQNQGAVEFYARVGNNWTYQGHYTSADGAAGDSFGTSVAISGNTAIVGSNYDDVGTNENQGAAYIFSRTGTAWTEQQKLTASDGALFNYFGISVAINGTTAIAGAYFNNAARGAAYVFTVANSTPFDYDGDGKSDVSLFRPSNGYWYLNNSSTGFTYTGFGISGDQIAPADYDGDGKTDLAVFRPSNGAWYLLRSSLGFTQIQFGANGDLPMPADFDGDGKAEIAIFRPSTGVWYQYNLANGQTTSIAFGITGDTPTAADYDGDGKADIAVFRPSSGTWYLNRSQLGFTAIQFGANGDKAVPGDYDADGKADLAVWRPSTGVWYLQQSQNGFSYAAFGIQNDLPAPADYDGDGKTDLGIFRPSSGTWYLQRSTQGFTQIQFGANGDKPTPNAFVP